MNPPRGPFSVSTRPARTARLRAILRGLETAVSIAFAMSPLTLAAFWAITGA